MIPLSGTGSWIEMLLYVGAGVVAAVYAWQVFLPKLRRLTAKRVDPAERAAELLAEYRRRERGRERGRGRERP